ncbi:MAG: DUF4864 domain-containing protein [Paracoccaceae bacterium]
MVRSLILAIILLVGPLGAGAQDRAVKGVIESQIEALQRDDFAAAFGFASPTIQQLFGNYENFGAMVRGGFPMVWRPADVQFLGQETQGTRVLQRVRIRDSAGEFHLLEYEMVMAGSGWQINGVRLLEMPDVGV